VRDDDGSRGARRIARATPAPARALYKPRATTTSGARRRAPWERVMRSVLPATRSVTTAGDRAIRHNPQLVISFARSDPPA